MEWKYWLSNEPDANSYSLQLPSGWSAKTWRGDNFGGGNPRCWTGSENNLQSHGWHLAIQSIEVFPYDACPHPTPQPTATSRPPTATPTPRSTATLHPATVTPTHTNTPHPPTATPVPQSCTNPPPDRNVAYLFQSTNCVNPWNWSSGHPSDSASHAAQSAWLPSGKVLLLSENNGGGEPSICLRSPVRNLADIGWGNRVEWAELSSSCPVIQPTPTPSGPKHEAKFYTDPNYQNHTFTLPSPGTYDHSDLGHPDQFKKFYSIDICSGCSIELTNVRGDSICWGWDENNVGSHGDWPLVTTQINFSHENDCPPRQPKFTSPDEGAQFWAGDSLQVMWKDNDDPTSMYFTIQVKRGDSIIVQKNRTTDRTLTVTNLTVGSYTIQGQSCSNIRCSDRQTRAFTVRAQPTATPTATFTPHPTATSTPTATATQCPPPPPASSNLVGDVDGDGDVDDNDLDIIVANFYWSGCPGWINADINLDGFVDIVDWSMAQSNFGQTLPAATPTPTPTPRIDFPDKPAIPHVQSPSDLMSISSGENVAFQWDQLPYPVNYLIYIYDEDGLRIGDSGSISESTWRFKFEQSGVYYWSISSLCRGCQNYFSGYGHPLSIYVDVDTLTPEPVCLISIGHGNLYTNRPLVSIHAEVSKAAEVKISNDRGFADATWQPYNEELDWTLRDPGQKIVTLLVYAQFRNKDGQLLCSGTALSDDIIYDPLPPSLHVESIRQTSLAEIQPATVNDGALKLIVEIRRVAAAWLPCASVRGRTCQAVPGHRSLLRFR